MRKFSQCVSQLIVEKKLIKKKMERSGIFFDTTKKQSWNGENFRNGINMRGLHARREA